MENLTHAFQSVPQLSKIQTFTSKSPPPNFSHRENASRVRTHRPRPVCPSDKGHTIHRTPPSRRSVLFFVTSTGVTEGNNVF